MYADPNLIRNHDVVKVRLNKYDSDITEEIVAITGGEKAVLVRELYLKSAIDFLESLKKEQSDDTSDTASA